ncbi:MAG: MFS transporter [Thermomicrobiales bacterium]
MSASGSTPPPSIDSIWAGAYLPLSIGSLMAVTVVAFQGLAMATVAPTVADAIGGENLYGWIFSAFLLPQIVGTVVGGQEVDRRSPASILLVAIVIFAGGTLLAGIAPSIWVLFGGRALQGLGAGAMFSTVYAVIGAAYPDHLRPSILAAMSSAWIVPSLIGPALAGFVADRIGWRWVFFGLVPLLVIVLVLALPVYRTFDRAQSEEPASRTRLLLSLGLTVGTGIFLAGLELRPWPLAVGAVAVGLVALVPTLHGLLPAGIFTARPMMPAAILTRALLMGGFLIGETYMIRALKEFGGVSATTAGIVLTVGSLTWTAGSWIQARWDQRSGMASRGFRVTAGVAILLVGCGGVFLTVAILRDIWIGVALAGWLAAGLGMGIAYTTCTTIVFAYAKPGEEGLASSSVLLGDLFMSSVGVGLGGVAYAVASGSGTSPEASSALVIGIGVAILALALTASFRLRAGDLAIGSHGK